MRPTSRHRDDPLLRAFVEGPAGVLPVERPVLLPSRAELDEATSKIALLDRLGTFARWAGEGRKLTAKGNLGLADGKELVALLGTRDTIDQEIRGRVYRTRSSVELREVDLVFRLARKAGFVKVRGGRVSVTRRGSALGRDPVEDWHTTFDGLLALGVLRHHFAHNRYFDPPWQSLFDDELPSLLWLLLGRDAPLEFERIAAAMWQLVEDTFVLDHLDDLVLDRHREQAGWDVRKIVNTLAVVGAVRVTGVQVRDLGYGFEREEGGEVSLTPLGTDAAHRLALSAGLDVPAVGAFRNADASWLLAGVCTLHDEDADVEINTWLGDRDPALAAQDVVAALDAAKEDIEQVAAAFRVLNRLPVPVAAAALQPCETDERLGPFVAAWREAHIGASETAPTVATLLALGTVESGPGIVHALSRIGDPAAQSDFLDRLRKEGPEAAAVLEQVAGSHPDKAISKAARKALFKLRSSST